MPKTKTVAKSQAAPSYSWVPILQVLVALIISYVAARKFVGYPNNLTLAFPLQFLSGLLIYFAFPKTFPVLDEYKAPVKEKAVKQAQPKKTKKAAPAGKVPFWPLLAVLVFAGAAVFFLYGSHFVPATIFIVLTMAGIVWFDRIVKNLPDSEADFDFSERKWFWVMIVFAAALRFAFAGTYFTGLQNDEGNNLTDTLAIMQNHESPFVTAWGGTPVLPYYWYVFLFQIFGPHIWLARVGSAIMSVGAIYFFYKWTRLWLSPLSALIGAFWFAVSWWFFFFSLSPFHNAVLALEEIAAFYFIEKAFRSGQRVHFCWAGLMAAGCVMNYVSGRSVPVMLGLMIIAYTVFRGFRFVKTYWKSILFFFLCFLWLVGPFIMYAFLSPGEVWGRVQPGWINQEYQHSGSYFFLVKSYAWSLFTLWISNPSVDFRFVVPDMTFMDSVTGVFALLGFCVFILNWRKPLAWVLLPGLLLGLSANALARLGWPTDLAYIQLVRLSIVLPFLFFPAAWGLDWFLRSYRKVFPRGWGWAGLLTAIAILGPLALNEPVFLSKFAFQSGTWGDHGISHMKIADIAMQEEKDHQVLIDSDATSNVVNFMVMENGLPDLTGLDISKDLPILYQARKDVCLMFSPWRITPAQQDLIHKLYPKAVWTNHYTPWNDNYIMTVEIPLEEIQAIQKGKTLLKALP